MVSPLRLAFGYIKYMKENKNNQFEGVRLPPVWCSSLCRNAMNEICVENCAVKRNCSGFEPKPDLKLIDMPPFPLRESADMTREERFTSVTIYLSKVVDHLQGRDAQLTPSVPRYVHWIKPAFEITRNTKDLQGETLPADNTPESTGIKKENK